MASSTKTFRLDDARTVTVNEYKGNVYFHFNDSKKAKSCSLSYEAFKKLISRGNRILDYANKIKPQKHEEEKKKKKNKEIDLSDVESMDSINFSD